MGAQPTKPEEAQLDTPIAHSMEPADHGEAQRLREEIALINARMEALKTQNDELTIRSKVQEENKTAERAETLLAAKVMRMERSRTPRPPSAEILLTAQVQQLRRKCRTPGKGRGLRRATEQAQMARAFVDEIDAEANHITCKDGFR